MKSSVLYIEFIEESLNSDSDSFIYYRLEYENTGHLRKDIKTSYGVCSDLFDLVSHDIVVYTLFSFDYLNKYLSRYENLNFNIVLLSSVLGLPENWGLYEIFSYYFDSNGVVLSDIAMLSSVLKLVIRDDIQYSYCFYLFENNTYSFEWFYIDNKFNIVRLDNLYIDLSCENKNFILGKFIKILRYKMVSSGCFLFNICFLTWNKENITTDIKRYISNIQTFDSVFNNIIGLRDKNYWEVIRLLSTDVKNSYLYSVKDFMDALAQSSKILNLKSSNNGTLTYVNIFCKDYSICTGKTIERKRGQWGIIIDCEGNRSTNIGLRELGGLIFYRHKDIMLVIDMFECSEKLLEETLQQVIRDYEVEINRYIPSGGIDIYTFGGTDECMIEDSLRVVGTKQFRRKLKKLFKYHDCRDYIHDYLDRNGLCFSEKKTLSNIAKKLGVSVVQPKHKALSDSRTLFNVLTYIYLKVGEWF